MPDKKRLILPSLVALSLCTWAIIVSVQLKQEHDLNKTLYKQVSNAHSQLSDSYNTLRDLKNKNIFLLKEKESILNDLKSLKERNDSLNKKLKELNNLKHSDSTSYTPPVSRGGGLSRSITMRATAYGTNEVDDYAGPDNRTASGVMPRVGVTIAADPDRLPMGTKVKIECASYPSINGDYIVQDTGNAIHGNRIDIYMGSNKRRMMCFGVRKVSVTVQD